MTDITTTGAAKRPTLLTVVCILSFILGAFGLWSGYSTAFTDRPQKELEKRHMRNQEMIDQMGVANPMVIEMLEGTVAVEKNIVKNARPIGYSRLATELLGLVAVGLMWNLKKNGFWLYLLSTVGALTTDFMYLTGGLLPSIALGIGILISAVFVILYGMNLKHMR